MKLQYWATRDKNSIVKNDDNYITIWSEKPACDDKTYNPVRKGIKYYSYDNTPSFLIQSISAFKKNFGFVPEKGTCQEVVMEFTLVRN